MSDGQSSNDMDPARRDAIHLAFRLVFPISVRTMTTVSKQLKLAGRSHEFLFHCLYRRIG
jgi:hypothetical protein